MSEISVSRAHALEPDEIRARIERLATRINGRIGGSWEWQGDEVVSVARGASARVGYDDRSVFVEISLPMTLRPFRGKLESKIEAYLAEYLA